VNFSRYGIVTLSEPRERINSTVQLQRACLVRAGTFMFTLALIKLNSTLLVLS